MRNEVVFNKYKAREENMLDIFKIISIGMLALVVIIILIILIKLSRIIKFLMHIYLK